MDITSQILLIDEQESYRMELKDMLSGLGDLWTCAKGSEAIAFLKGTPIDLILLDLSILKSEGFETLKEIKRSFPDIAVLMITSSEDDDLESKALELGAVDFIQKQTKPPIIRARVKVHLTLKHQTDLIRCLSNLDALTGIANRRALDVSVLLEWRRACRNGSSLAFLMIDIDFFKQYNDVYGHLVGDQCLIRIAKSINSSIRRTGDLAARYGGEEFAVLLPNTDLEGGQAMATKIMASIKALYIPNPNSSVDPFLTVSMGLSVCQPQKIITTPNPEASHQPLAPFDEAFELINRADKALYAAKSAGRNRLMVDKTIVSASQ